jgi:hypothetical protein
MNLNLLGERNPLRSLNSSSREVPVPVKLDVLLLALEAASFDGAIAYLCLATGEFLVKHEIFDQFDEIPDDIDDESKYVALPGKRDLGLGKPLALAFAREHLPEDFDDVREIFGKRGAYRRFHDLLIRRDARDRWFAFEAEETARALKEWCAEMEIEVSG